MPAKKVPNTGGKHKSKSKSKKKTSLRTTKAAKAVCVVIVFIIDCNILFRCNFMLKLCNIGIKNECISCVETNER